MCALEKVLSCSKVISQNLILHSGQGGQFTSTEFVQHCRKRGFSPSMSRAGCPYDNAPMELYYNSLKTELIISIVWKLQQNWIMPSQSLLTFCTIKYAHTRITDILLRLKRERSVSLSSGVTKNVDHYNPNRRRKVSWIV